MPRAPLKTDCWPGWAARSASQRIDARPQEQSIASLPIGPEPCRSRPAMQQYRTPWFSASDHLPGRYEAISYANPDCIRCATVRACAPLWNSRSWSRAWAPYRVPARIYAAAFSGSPACPKGSYRRATAGCAEDRPSPHRPKIWPGNIRMPGEDQARVQCDDHDGNVILFSPLVGSAVKNHYWNEEA